MKTVRRVIHIPLPNEDLRICQPYLRNPTFVCPAPGRLIPIGKIVLGCTELPLVRRPFAIATRNTCAT